MNFEKIELQGFKSFADKTEIPFADGITGIVGPNGCGKSNISDAVMWVLGEQRPTALRGKAMTDVLFAGTDTRKATSYCEVSLHFDNSKKIFPVDFEKVELTRKLYRSGESDYLINRTKCRRKDIVDILHDTGIGRDGYSIIGQGKVEQILSAKPEERRAIFEEAAGIGKFRAQKTETERKLEKTNENMHRINDILFEKENRLGPLKRQSEQAIKHRELKEELKVEEVNSYIYQYENNTKFKDEINDKLFKIVGSLHDAEVKQEAVFKEYEESQAKVNSLDKELNELKEERTNLLVNLEKATGNSNLYGERIAKFNEDIKRLTDEIESSKKLIEINKNNLELAINNRQNLQDEYEKLEVEYNSKDAKYQELAKELQDEETAIEISNKTILEVEQQLGDIKGNVNKYLTEKTMLEDRIQELENDLASKKSTLNTEYEEQQENEKKIEKYNQKRVDIIRQSEVLKQEYIDIKSSCNRIIKEKEDLNNRASALKGKLSSLENMKDKYDDFKYPVQQLMRDTKTDSGLRRRVLGVVAEVIKVPDGYETAIEQVLGNTLQNLICEDEEAAEYVINYLKYKKYGRVTLLPITSMKSGLNNWTFDGATNEKGCLGIASEIVEYDAKFRNVIESILGKILIVDNIANARNMAKKHRYAFKIVTLEGDIISPSGSYSGGSNRSNNDNLLTRDKAIEECREKLNEAIKKVEEKNKEYDFAESELNNVTERVESLKEELHSNDMYIIQINERISSSEDAYDELKEIVDKLAYELEEKKSRLREIVKQLSTIDILQARIREERESKDESIKQSKNLSSSKKEEREKLNEEVTSLKIEMIHINGKISNLDTTINNAKDDIVTLNEKIGDNEVRININKGQITNAEKEAMRFTFSDEERQRITVIEAKIKKMESEKLNIQNVIADLDRQKTEIINSVNDLKEKRIRQESLLERVDNNMTTLGDSIFESYQLTYNNATPLRVENYEYKGSDERIKNLRRRINSMGSVNELAVEEYEECLTSYNELMVQKQDLDKAQDDLNKIIADLSKEMETKFVDAFDKISANFVVIFKELFGGGKGELRLEQVEDEGILDQGIEIYAQPPGTKLQRISLLSGGQKALTAIAILFAILKLKPMPFCILDEIEAALDDANAGLFAEYLRKFSDNTQFIVITHRKPTMELTHCMYGVTMQERGVSKIVSVKLEDALKQEGVK